jgi:hypothetical protein
LVQQAGQSKHRQSPNERQLEIREKLKRSITGEEAFPDLEQAPKAESSSQPGIKTETG